MVCLEDHWNIECNWLEARLEDRWKNWWMQIVVCLEDHRNNKSNWLEARLEDRWTIGWMRIVVRLEDHRTICKSKSWCVSKTIGLLGVRKLWIKRNLVRLENHQNSTMEGSECASGWPQECVRGMQILIVAVNKLRNEYLVLDLGFDFSLRIWSFLNRYREV